MYRELFGDPWLETLTDKEWRVYWQLLVLVLDRSENGRVTHSWHILSCLLGMRNKNMTLFRILKRFHEDEKVIWENYTEFAERIPVDFRCKLGINPEIGVSKRGTIPKWKVCKGGRIYDHITLFSPQAVATLREEMSEIRHKLGSPFSPCRYYAECKLRRSVGECDRCSDPSLAEQTLRDALSRGD